MYVSGKKSDAPSVALYFYLIFSISLLAVVFSPAESEKKNNYL